MHVITGDVSQTHILIFMTSAFAHSDASHVVHSGSSSPFHAGEMEMIKMTAKIRLSNCARVAMINHRIAPLPDLLCHAEFHAHSVYSVSDKKKIR